MKWLNYLFFVLFLFNTNIYSQDSTKSYNFMIKPWSIQFRISDNFNLSYFNGKNISIKKHFNNNSAIRLSISVEGNSENKSRNSGIDISSQYQNDKTNDDSYTFVVNPQYIYYFNKIKNPLIYIGSGPFWEYSNTIQDVDRYDYDSNTLMYISSQKKTSNSNSIGLSFLFGAEVFITNYISIHSEYSSSIKYYEAKLVNKSETKSFDPNILEIKTKNTEKIDRWNLNWNNVLFGISVYF